MLRYFIVVEITLIIWLMWRTLRGNKTPITIGLLICLITISGYFEYQHTSMQQRYTTATRILLHRKDTYVVCERFSNALLNLGNYAGEVKWKPGVVKPDRADLTWETCKNLHSWETSNKKSDNIDQIIAVHVLTHESMHLDGYFSESEAECRAVQKDNQMAQILGATKSDAHILSQKYWNQVYPRLPDNYKTTDCKENGSLDQTPNDGTWP